MSYRSKYFKVSEYICPCGCDLVAMHDNALYMFDKIREKYGKPMVVNSGCRCKDYNEKIGGSPNSAHTLHGGYTYAIDTPCTNSTDRYKLIKAALECGCKRIGIAKTFIHLDCCPDLDQNVIWLY